MMSAYATVYVISLLAVAFALGDRPVWCVVAVLVSLLVHPVAIFAILKTSSKPSLP